MSVNSWSTASPEQVSLRAYHHHLARNSAAGHVVHGFDQDDHRQAVEDLTLKFPDAVSFAEFRVARLGLKTFTWWESLRWNQLVLKFLVNDYFPLLRSDDMVEYGDRIGPLHALDLLIQRDRMAFRDRGATEEEWDDLHVCRKSVREVMSYVTKDFAERRGHLATSLVRKQTAGAHDVRYVWLGQSYVSEEMPVVGPKPKVPGDHLNRRIPREGEILTVSRIEGGWCGNHPTAPRKLKVGDKIKVTRVSRWDNTPVAWYRLFSGEEHYVRLVNLSSQYFKVYAPPGWNHVPSPQPDPQSKFDDSYRTKKPGLNAYSDCSLLDQDYQYTYRVTPAHLADIVALRFLDVVTSQQAKVLLTKCWNDFGWHDVFHHVRESGMLDEVDGDLRNLVQAALAGQPQAVADYQGGWAAAFGRLMGAAMKSCAGRAKPADVKAVLEELLV